MAAHTRAYTKKEASGVKHETSLFNYRLNLRCVLCVRGLILVHPHVGLIKGMKWLMIYSRAKAAEHQLLAHGSCLGSLPREGIQSGGQWLFQSDFSWFYKCAWTPCSIYIHTRCVCGGDMCVVMCIINLTTAGYGPKLSQHISQWVCPRSSLVLRVEQRLHTVK